MEWTFDTAAILIARKVQCAVCRRAAQDQHFYSGSWEKSIHTAHFSGLICCSCTCAMLRLCRVLSEHMYLPPCWKTKGRLALRILAFAVDVLPQSIKKDYAEDLAEA